MNFHEGLKTSGILASEIDRLPVIDSHEHLMPIAFRNRTAVDFSYLFGNYLRPEFVSSGMSAQDLERFYSPKTPEDQKIALFECFWPILRNTSFARLKKQAAEEIYGVREFTPQGLRRLSLEIRRSARPDWYIHLLQGSGIRAIILNYLKTHRLLGWSEPEEDPLFFATANFDDFVWIASAADVEALEAESGREIGDLSDLIATLRILFKRRLGPRVCVIKTVLAYFRTLEIQAPDRSAAESIFQRLLEEPSREFDLQLRGQDVPWARPFQDFMLHQIFQLAGKQGLPVQIHVGYQAGNGNWVTNSDPSKLIPVFFAHPKVRFELLHVGYPYHLVALTLAKMFPNVWINFSWFFALAPTAGRDALHQAIELVPAGKVVAFGGDYRLIEGVIVHLKLARRIVSRVLEERLAEGYFSEAEALDYASRIFFENPRQLYGIEAKPLPTESSGKRS